MTIQHIVSFAFPSATPSILSEVSRRFFELKETCLNEKGEKYIVSIRGGRQDNWEERNKGLTHVYLLEFKTHEDRKYYIDKDPSHNDFKLFIGPLVEDALVLDFTENVW